MQNSSKDRNIKAQVGQRWRDNDARCQKDDREVVLVEAVEKGGHPAFRCDVYERGVRTAKQTVIRADRFKPNATGYKLVEPPPKPT
jgi:hypothetical protein